jgi:hypothetical protein
MLAPSIAMKSAKPGTTITSSFGEAGVGAALAELITHELAKVARAMESFSNDDPLSWWRRVLRRTNKRRQVNW